MNEFPESPQENNFEPTSKEAVLPAESEFIPSADETPPSSSLPQSPLTTKEETKPAWRNIVAPAWFLLGIIVGLAVFAGYTQYTTKPAPPPPTLDAAVVKQAARDGLVEAIQTIQAASAQAQNPQAAQGPQAVSKDAFAIRPANRLGNENAKVTIVEYADFQCPYCERYYKTIEPEIKQLYIETGKANLVYKNLAFLGPESVYAAVASECAADQGKFWEYHDYLFDHQGGENQGTFTKDHLLAFGKDLNLDMTTFQTCVQNDATLERVQADTAEAQKFGVTSTPTFFINGQPLVGLQSADQLKQMVEQASNQ